ncbi:MAG: ABC transporter ATP-binding protein [Deltaproteobacteria bacterium]|nr:ABC transporter ATP-binding protein [Deltaproteobacteria bacterium]
MLRLRRRAAEPEPEPTADLALEARDLERAFGDNRAVAGLSLALRPGELYGLVGPDGAGKTTTIRLLTGLITPDAGVAFIAGRRVAPGSSETLEALGYMPQQYSLYGDLSVHENLWFFGKLFGLSGHAMRERRDRLLEVTRLARFGDRRASALSGGMYKKLALACALLHQPRVLLLDEPTNGVDPVSRRELWDLLHEFLHEGMAIIVATPYMDEASRCQRVGLMHRGRLLAEGRPDELVRAFEHETLLLHTDDRDALEEDLASHDEVLAVSPHGSAVRVVVRAGAAEAFRRTLPEAIRLEAVAPDFEDVFLARVRDAETASGVGGPRG